MKLFAKVKKTHNLDDRGRKQKKGITEPVSRPAILNWGQLCPLGDIWQYLETFWVATVKEVGECCWPPVRVEVVLVL